MFTYAVLSLFFLSADGLTFSSKKIVLEHPSAKENQFLHLVSQGEIIVVSPSELLDTSSKLSLDSTDDAEIILL